MGPDEKNGNEAASELASGVDLGCLSSRTRWNGPRGLVWQESGPKPEQCISVAFMAQVYPWEVEPTPSCPWENQFRLDSDSDGENDEPTAAEAEEQLASFLMDLHLRKILSAKNTCILAWWAMNAGLSAGPISAMAMKPDASSGHYQRKLDKLMVFGKQLRTEAYLLKVPSYNKFDVSRCETIIPVLLPHEQIRKEIANNDSIAGELQSLVVGRSLPDDYYNHPVVKGEPLATVYPVDLYLDGVPTTKKDGLIAFHVVNVITGARHIVAALRKSRLCQCGCRGWCTLHAIWTYLQWSFSMLSKKTEPEYGPDGQACSRPPNACYAICCLLHMRGDWAEISLSIGFPTWADKNNPCYQCWCTRDNWKICRGVSAATWPWPLKDQDGYDAACTACEVKVRVVSEDTLRKIVALLRYDKSSTSSAPRGRALIADVPEVFLLRLDRLEPSSSLRDIGLLTVESSLPLILTFWRRSRETATRHRNPMFSDPRICTARVIVVDELHTMHLGVFQCYIAKVFNIAIDEDVYCIGRSDKATSKTLTVARTEQCSIILPVPGQAFRGKLKIAFCCEPADFGSWSAADPAEGMG